MQQVLRWAAQTCLAQAFPFAIQGILCSIKAEVHLKSPFSRQEAVPSDKAMERAICHYALYFMAYSS